MSRKKTKLQKFKKLPGLQPGLRMKGGVLYDPLAKGVIAIVHTWDNRF